MADDQTTNDQRASVISSQAQMIASLQSQLALMRTDGESEVIFTVKELFQQIVADTKDIKSQLSLKADASRVNGIDKCLRDMLSVGSPTSQKNERDITTLDQKVDKLTWKVAGMSGGIVVVLELARMALTYLKH